MSEQNQQQTDSPLVGERGRTTISDSVVSQIAGMAAQEVDGVHMGGSASRAAGGFLGSITGSEGQTRGVSVQIGMTEVAIDLTMGVEYGRNILEVVEEVRRRISERVPDLTGLQVTELNATISDIVFPEDGGRRRTLQGTSTSTTPDRELESGERETTAASPRGQTTTESGPLQEDETAELGAENESGTRRPSEEDETTRRTERLDER
jgi:uncharacterized alkaline shock family protein YloU